MCHHPTGLMLYHTILKISNNMRLIFYTLSCLFLVSSINGQAADPPFSKAYSPCLKAAAGETGKMLDCINTEYQLQDALLNKNYKTLLAKQNNKRKKTLTEAQRAWIKFRDSHCAFIADEDGQAAQVAAEECQLSETTVRAQALKDLLN
jgi:uncharacterized protein YecT (DUF1311 family)